MYNSLNPGEYSAAMKKIFMKTQTSESLIMDEQLFEAIRIKKVSSNKTIETKLENLKRKIFFSNLIEKGKSVLYKVSCK